MKATQEMWDGASSNHHFMRNIIVNMAQREDEDSAAGKAIEAADNYLDKSVAKHFAGDHKGASRYFGLSSRQLNLASRVGEHPDKNYGMSWDAANSADNLKTLYEHGYGARSSYGD